MQSTNHNNLKESSDISKELHELGSRKLSQPTSEFINNLLSIVNQNILKGLVRTDPDQYNQIIDYIDYYTRNGDEDAAVMVLKTFDEHKANGLRFQMADNIHKMFVEGSPTYNKLKREQEQTQEKKKDIDASRTLRVTSLNNLNELVKDQIIPKKN